MPNAPPIASAWLRNCVAVAIRYPLITTRPTWTQPEANDFIQKLQRF